MPGIPLHHFAPSLNISSEFTPCSSTSPSCKSNIHPTKYMETPSKVAMQGVCSTNVLCGEDNEISLKCQKKKSLIQNVWNNIGENLVRKSNMILSKMSNPLSVKIMNNDIIDTKFFENPMEHKKQSIDKPYDYKIQEKKSDIMSMADKDLQSLDTSRSFLIDHEGLWVYYDSKDYQIDEIKNIENSTETMGSNNTSKNNNTMESHTLCIREVKESNNTDNSCPMNVEYTNSDKEILEKNKGKIFHYNIDTNEGTSMNAESICIVSESDVPQLVMDFTEEIPAQSNPYQSDTCQKVWKSNPFRLVHIDSEIAAKRSKLDIGGKFRTSDVSQTSYHKQHINHDDLDIKIQDDHKTCQNVEDYYTIQNNTSLSPSDLHDADHFDVTDDAQAIKCTVTSRLSHSFNFLSMKDELCIQKKIEQETAKFPIREDSSNDSSIMSEESEESEDSESQTSSQDVSCKNFVLQSRSLSDSSIDSEDSFCILFEDESKVGSTIDSDESDFTDQNSEDDLVIDMINEDDENSEKSTQAKKVLKKRILDICIINYII
jgi:hypothetical protein